MAGNERDRGAPADPAPSPVAAGRPTRWRWRAPCGDELERDGDRLAIAAAFPLEGLELSRFRNPVLRVRGERYELTGIEGTARRPLYRLRMEEPNLYAPPGELLLYDGERHRERAVERRRVALAWLLYLPLVPLTPLLGLLPESLKERLGALGFNPARASRLSLSFEWLLLFFATLAYLMSGGFFTVEGAILAPLCLLLALDIAYRVSSDYDGRAPGMFGVLGALRTWGIESWRGRHGLPLPPAAPQDVPPPASGAPGPEPGSPRDRADAPPTGQP